MNYPPEIVEFLTKYDRIILAWGNHGAWRQQDLYTLEFLKNHNYFYSLGTTKKGECETIRFFPNNYFSYLNIGTRSRSRLRYRDRDRLLLCCFDQANNFSNMTQKLTVFT